MQKKVEPEGLNELAVDEARRLSAREQELLDYRELIRRQEHELDAYRKRLKEEQLAREKELQKELESRERFFAEREKSLIERQRDFEMHLMRRQSETEALRTHLQQEIVDREAKLQQALVELQQEKERYSEESRRKIERTSKDYVVETLDTLDRKEKQFHRISRTWSFVGAISIVGGIAFFIYVTVSSSFASPAQITWEFLAFSAFKGLMAIALLAGLVRYSFLFSSSYMQEALKNADRRHAINFGKFYLESYGAAADWAQVKEAFEHWNISGSNAFNRAADNPPEISALDKAVSLIERANNALQKAHK